MVELPKEATDNPGAEPHLTPFFLSPHDTRHTRSFFYLYSSLPYTAAKKIETMKQAQLSFTNVKRSGTAAGLGKTQSAKAVAKPIASGTSEAKPERTSLKKEEREEVESGSELEEEQEKLQKEKKGTKSQKSTRRSLGETTELKIQPGPKKIDVSDLPSLDVKSKSLDGIWNETKNAMGMPKTKPSTSLLS